VESIVEMMLDATRQYDQPLTKKRLFGWHASLFPAGRSRLVKIRAGAWRNDRSGPMQVVSGSIGHERIHHAAPPAERLDAEMPAFLDWYNKKQGMDPIMKASLAHLWFTTIHPFDDGNGRIARAIADMALARSEETAQRFYNMSAQIRVERNAYYDALEATQKKSMNVTDWHVWFLSCLVRAIGGAQDVLSSVLLKARFWERHGAAAMNERQIKAINRMLDGFEGKLTSSKWAKRAKCSQDTAHQDILDLMKRGVLKKNPGGGRSTNYDLTNI
jgi:Fic family protein